MLPSRPRFRVSSHTQSGVGEFVVAACTQIDGQCACAGWGEHHQPALPGGAGAFERDEAEDGVLDQVGGKGVHDHAEQFLPADSLAAEDADDGVITGHLKSHAFPLPVAWRRSSMNSAY